MTFEQLAAIVRDWQSRLTSAQVRAGVESLRRQLYISDLPDAIPLDAVMAAIAKGGPAPVLDRKAEPEPAPAQRHQAPPHRTAPPSGPGLRGRPSKRAQALVRQQLADGSRLGEQVLAAASRAEIPERTLIAAADALGVRARKGQWWLPGRIDRNRAGPRPAQI